MRCVCSPRISYGEFVERVFLLSKQILEAKPRAIFLCLPQALDHAAMIASSAAVAEASKEAGVSRLVRISSVGIDGGAQVVFKIPKPRVLHWV